MVFVQEPASAKFDGMPRSAIEASLADVIARISGDEFAVLLPHTDTGVAKALLNRAQQAIKENNKACSDEPISLSMGVNHQ